MISQPFMVDATVLQQWQSCKRQALLAAEWKPSLWRPKILFTATFRKAVFQISNGKDVEAAASDAKASFMQEAANPGMDLPRGSKPYMIAREWCALLDTTLGAVGRLSLLTLEEAPEVPLEGGILWRPRAWRDQSGQLHRWIITDYWGDDERYRELHGWHTFGDIAVTECPLMLHVIEIGQQRAGRRISSWTRGFRHPGLPHLKMRFRKGDGSELTGWNPVYLADGREGSSKDWVEQMAAEGECERLMHHVTINVPSRVVCEETRTQIATEANLYRTALYRTKWHTQPMSRGACDLWTPCPYQPLCYSEKLLRPEDIGGFRPVVSPGKSYQFPRIQRPSQQPQTVNA